MFSDVLLFSVVCLLPEVKAARMAAFHAVAVKLRYVKRLKNTWFSHFWSKTATKGDQSQA